MEHGTEQLDSEAPAKRMRAEVKLSFEALRMHNTEMQTRIAVLESENSLLRGGVLACAEANSAENERLHSSCQALRHRCEIAEEELITAKTVTGNLKSTPPEDPFE